MDQGVHTIAAAAGFLHHFQLTGNIFLRLLVDMDIHISIQIDAGTPPGKLSQGRNIPSGYGVRYMVESPL